MSQGFHTRVSTTWSYFPMAKASHMANPSRRHHIALFGGVSGSRHPFNNLLEEPRPEGRGGMGMKRRDVAETMCGVWLPPKTVATTGVRGGPRESHYVDEQSVHWLVEQMQPGVRPEGYNSN